MYRVMIVDDEPFILDGIESIIQWEDLGLEVAGKYLDGSEALKALEHTKAHIIITDIKMTVVDGLDLIRQAKAKDSDIKFIILSGYNEFGYVKEAARLGIENYLLKPVDKDELYSTLAATVEKIDSHLYQKLNRIKEMDTLKQNILYRWVTNAISQDELEDKSSFLDINLICEEYTAAIVRPIYKASGNLPVKGDPLPASSSIYNICSRITDESGLGVALGDMAGNTVIIFMGDRPNESEIRLLLTKCISIINEVMKSDVFITVGGRSESVSESYMQALELLDYYLVMPPNSIADSQSLSKSAEDGAETVNIDFEMLKGIIASRTRDVIPDFIEGIFSSFGRTAAVPKSTVQNAAAEILFYISSYIREQKKGSVESFNRLKNSFSGTLNVKTLEFAKKWISELISATIDFLDTEESNESPIIKNILNYINTNFYKNMSLKTLSSTFIINAAYLGQLFKKETGEMFSDYLNRLRVEKAKELLLSTDLNAGRISEKVGYTDDNYFFKIFKKITGMSPSEYRNIKSRPPL